MRSILAATAMAGALGVAAGALIVPAPATSSCTSGARAMMRTELAFGLSRRDGRVIAPEAWTQFVDSEVSSRLPDGFTLFDGQGQWRDSTSGRIVREPSRLLLVFHAPGPESAGAIGGIRDAYRRQFDQDSVLLAQAPACVGF